MLLWWTKFHCNVPPEVSGASRFAKEVLFPDIIGGFATLPREFTLTCLFDPSEMLTIATCTHVHRTGRESNVNSHSCDCYPGFQETVVDEKRFVEMLTLEVVLVPKETSNGSK